MEPLVAVTTFARKAFCLAANSGSRDRDDLFEVEPVVVEFVVLLLLWKKERFIYTWSRIGFAQYVTADLPRLDLAGFKASRLDWLAEYGGSWKPGRADFSEAL